MSSSSTLNDLRDEAASFACALAQEDLRRAAGLPLDPDASVAKLLRAHPRVGSGEGLAQIVETLAQAQAQAGPQGENDPARAGRVSRLSSLRDALARARGLSLEPGAADELRAFPRRRTVRIAGDAGLHGALPAVQVERELPLVRSRDRRGEMERALADATEERAGADAGAWEAAQAALLEAVPGASRPDVAAAALHARGWPGPPGDALTACTAACEELLQATADVAQDLGGWLLQRHTGARPHPGGAERHDVLHLIHAPACATAFPRGEVARTLRRWSEAFAIDLSAAGALRVDEEDRPEKRAGAAAFRTDPPDRVDVSACLVEGPAMLASLLGALGEGLLWTAPPGGAPREDALFADPGVPGACAGLMGGLARDPAWLRRCARVDLARDDERALACAALFEARALAAAVLGSLAAHRDGPGARAREAHRELYARAVGAELPAALALDDLDPWLAPWGRLRGLAFAALTRARLRDRFDEDWWRNPRARGPVQGLFARGGRPTLSELAGELGVPLGAGALAAELIEACR